MGLNIEKLNTRIVELSNGIELRKGDRINPYSYSVILQDAMIKETIKNHFLLEKKLMEQSPRIKPLSLFFIDNIENYRQKDGKGNMQLKIEEFSKQEIEKLLKDSSLKSEYRKYLGKTLQDLSKLHGGYFSQDNKDTDENIEKEVNEILYDKVSLLSLENPRRFIVSKWTLKEGWDNPNIFQICKLRSSGSETSKLQEVGRGLRLPVNEFMAREKGGKYKLNYYVDFTEKDFVNKLIGEINKSASITYNKSELEEKLIKKISEVYHISDDELLEKLDEEGIINRANKFKTEDGLEKIKRMYPLVFEELKSNKITEANKKSKKISIRVENYRKLQKLWEKLNEKAILNYNIGNENDYYKLFLNMFEDKQEDFIKEKIYIKKINIEITDKAQISEINESNTSYSNFTKMDYDEFLKRISIELNVNIKTLHKVFITLEQQDVIKTEKLFSVEVIRKIKKIYLTYLLEKYIVKEKISYEKVNVSIHPTTFTNSEKMDDLREVNSSDLGVLFEDSKAPKKYLFDEIYYDSDLEMKNIKNPPESVTVYTKIPKNSIKIPVVGGLSYSPDFAYIVEYKNGSQILNLVVETKGKEERTLGLEEKKKIESAKMYFEMLNKYNSSDKIEIKFEKQLTGVKISDIINKIISI